MSSLKEYMEKLDCPDEAERIYAAEDIGYLNAPDGVPPLLERLGKEPSRAVRGGRWRPAALPLPGGSGSGLSFWA